MFVTTVNSSTQRLHHCYTSIFKRKFGKTSLQLPPLNEWKSHFPLSAREGRPRVFLHNEATAAGLAKAFIEDTDFKNTSTGRVVIEAFPGPGVLTRALIRYPKSVIRRLIVLEDVPMYLKYLKGLEEIDPRVVVIPSSGYEWSTYRQIEEQGLLEGVAVHPWGTEIHPGLQFISHLPHSVHGEQLIAQLIRCISERRWLYKYGRTTMNIILGDWVWQRINASAGSIARCKLGVIAEASSNFQEAVPSERLKPYSAHFYPSASPQSPPRAENRRIGHSHVAVTFKPKVDPAIDANDLDKWDFVLRKLFVLKSQPLQKVLPTLAPGAHNLLKILTATSHPERMVDTSKPVKSLDLDEWKRVLLAFNEWPFAPDMLFISESVTSRNNNR